MNTPAYVLIHLLTEGYMSAQGSGESTSTNGLVSRAYCQTDSIFSKQS
jgi:hypothetical protein